MRRLKRVKVVKLPKNDPVVKTYEVKTGTATAIPVEMPVRKLVEVEKEPKTQTVQNSY